MVYVGSIQSLTEAVRNDSVSVSTSSILIADIRPSTLPRKDILVRNISGDGTVITVALGNSLAVANKGIILNDGESFSFSSEATNPCPQCQFTAIASAVTGVLSIMER